jgi:SAM-dependent methyltransferase
MQWFENEDFWRELYPYMFPPSRFEAAASEVDSVLQLAKIPKGKVLDLCCGPGRHSVEFARRGFKVTGVDASTFLLARARERASASKVTVEWIHHDMRHFCGPSSFDLACCMFTSFGYFESAEENEKVARNLYESLRPDGVLIIDVIGKERIARIWKDSIVTEFADGALLVQLPKVVKDWTRLSNRWLLTKDGIARTFQFEHAIYSGKELRDLLLRSGFKSVELYGSLQGIPYGLEAERLIAVARRNSSQQKPVE